MIENVRILPAMPENDISENKKGYMKNHVTLLIISGVPKGIRTPVAGVKGLCPGPG